MEGWFKFHRKTLLNPIVCKDADHLSVWVYLLANATHKDYPALFKGERITLKPGQLIIGRKAISSFLKVDESKIQRILKLFENEQQIEQQTSNKNRLISIVNWHNYQDGEQQNEQQVNNKCTTSEQQVNTNKNVRIKECKNKRINKTYSDNPILNEAWESFVEMRKKIKAPLTDRAITLATNKLDKLASTDEEKIAILNQSTMNCWKGLFELKDKKQTGGGQRSQFEANNDWKPTDLFE